MDRVNVVYPPKTFALSAADAVSLENLADQLVAETLRTHDDFISQGRVVDPTRWKVVKEKHNMTAYRTRKRTSTRSRRDRVPSDETEAVAASPQMPSFYPVMDKKMEHALSETSSLVNLLLRIKVMESRGVVYPPTPLQLSPEDERSIEMIADRLVAETLHASEDFAAHRHVTDPSSWKRIKEKGNIVAYQDISNLRSTKRERVWSEDTVVVAASPQNPTFYPSNRSLEDEMFREGFHNIDDYDSEDESSLHHDDFTKFGAKPGAEISVLEKFRPANVPTVFSHGIIPGTVEDMAFAFLADTDERSRTRFNTNKDVVVEDMRILAQIHGPTKEDPFRFLGVKWCYSMPSRTVSLVVKSRDYLIIEATGMALDSNGERFTYLLNHSIELDQVPAFRDFGLVRTVFSACHIMKPYQNGEAVDAYARGFLHIGGSFSCTVRKMLPVQGARGRHMKKKEREFCLDCYLKAKRLPAWHVAVATLAKSSP
ncbi:hypothetical protein JG688_00008381 [Phytophthora aleatoria]|uniref:START domain-containing protein n=1 Tax=Phytophthora aleatoria TaxID=2496075 RepID=A0A8J5J739_9STRA|nr:hypothetical protein JG688_00008381 [Phytophthora aleatoria]